MAYLGGYCAICKYAGCVSAFDFHHVEAWRKDFTISAHMTSWEKILPELRKCTLLCCRCHREVHDGLHPGFLELEESNRGDTNQLDLFDDLEVDVVEVPTT